VSREHHVIGDKEGRARTTIFHVTHGGERATRSCALVLSASWLASQVRIGGARSSKCSHRSCRRSVRSGRACSVQRLERYEAKSEITDNSSASSAPRMRGDTPTRCGRTRSKERKAEEEGTGGGELRCALCCRSLRPYLPCALTRSSPLFSPLSLCFVARSLARSVALSLCRACALSLARCRGCLAVVALFA